MTNCSKRLVRDTVTAFKEAGALFVTCCELGLLEEVGVLVAEGQDGTSQQRQHQHDPSGHQLPDGAEVHGAAAVLAGLVQAGLESGLPQSKHPVRAGHVPGQEKGGEDPVHHAERARGEGRVTVRAARAWKQHISQVTMMLW